MSEDQRAAPHNDVSSIARKRGDSERHRRRTAKPSKPLLLVATLGKSFLVSFGLLALALYFGARPETLERVMLWLSVPWLGSWYLLEYRPRLLREGDSRTRAIDEELAPTSIQALVRGSPEAHLGDTEAFKRELEFISNRNRMYLRISVVALTIMVVGAGVMLLASRDRPHEIVFLVLSVLIASCGLVSVIGRLWKEKIAADLLLSLSLNENDWKPVVAALLQAFAKRK